ncbi:MAG: protein translocase subunit SecD [Patescibacteria group bacterium]|nr:protein translocase subunit SecD [Patescibacteria group bacterium]
MIRIPFMAVLLITIGIAIGYFDFTRNVASPDKEPQLFKYGLDLSSGIHLEYLVDVSSTPPEEVDNIMKQLRSLIERRVNMFGVSEPTVQTKRQGLFGLGDNTKERKLIVQLPSIDSLEEAQTAIGGIPVLEFRDNRPAEDFEKIKEILAAREEFRTALIEKRDNYQPNPLAFEEIHLKTDLTGRFLETASYQYNPSLKATNPNRVHLILLKFNSEGAELFAELTKKNAGKTVPIYIDGNLISNPNVDEKEFGQTGITGGNVELSGGFDMKTAKDLAWRLNSGALPVDKLELSTSRPIGAALGEKALHSGIQAGVWGLALVALFLILWYRLPGFLAVIALSIYVVLMLALFKVLPVTITVAGIAGFILSIGMAVDANILIFERMKEEWRAGRTLEDAIREGFARAWPSIRDGNLSSIITAIVLFWFGTILIKGFAITFSIGILISMLSAITISRTLLLAVSSIKNERIIGKLFGMSLRSNN